MADFREMIQSIVLKFPHGQRSRDRFAWLCFLPPRQEGARRKSMLREELESHLER